jgi:hypothetical protein
MDDELLALARQTARERGISLSEAVREAIKVWIDPKAHTIPPHLRESLIRDLQELIEKRLGKSNT